jgi:hypothetical protein
MHLSFNGSKSLTCFFGIIVLIHCNKTIRSGDVDVHRALLEGQIECNSRFNSFLLDCRVLYASFMTSMSPGIPCSRNHLEAYQLMQIVE